MPFDLAQMIEDTCEELGDHVRFRDAYSGRGMNGRYCVGVVCQPHEFRDVLAYTIKNMTASIASAAKSGDDNMLADVENDFDINLDGLLNYCDDNMGVDRIFYWPTIQPIAN